MIAALACETSIAYEKCTLSSLRIYPFRLVFVYLFPFPIFLRFPSSLSILNVSFIHRFFTEYSLNGIPEDLISSWRAYFNFKACCYRAYVSIVTGLITTHVVSRTLGLVRPWRSMVPWGPWVKADEHRGLADDLLNATETTLHQLTLSLDAEYALHSLIRFLHCENARRAARAYASGSGAEVAFFRKLQPFASRTLSKAQTENSMIYHQPVPSSLAELKLKATFGIATPEMPALVFTHDEEWKEAVNGFDVTKMLDFLSRKDVRSESGACGAPSQILLTPGAGRCGGESAVDAAEAKYHYNLIHEQVSTVEHTVAIVGSSGQTLIGDIRGGPCFLGPFSNQNRNPKCLSETMVADGQASRKKKEAAKLHVIKEQPIYHGVRDPGNASGCVIS
ncbi:unnamed protein product [Schistocephalus solidus]|uniref:Uncharacterized protein n=1 Tax=Schistocephalus solidus TaxID=70667 RepID=A0A3P7DBT3_SCHSO|nr:unnamed protein product [Schistocephalus solidus]